MAEPTGSSGNATQLQGRDIAETAPADGEVLKWNEIDEQWGPGPDESGAGGGDATAIHDDVSGEINAIAEKTILADDDVFIIEDSAASFAKKKVKKINLPGSGPMAVLVYNNAIQNVNSHTWTALTFNSEYADDGDFHSTSSNTGRLTAPVAGWYDIFADIEFEKHATGQRYIRFVKNGTTVIGHIGPMMAIATVNTRVNLSIQAKLTVNDYVQVEAYQDSGGALAVNYAAAYAPNFGMALRR
jgi:hypothetical protein